MTIDFLDMDVLIEAPGGDPRVRVIKSPAGETTSQPFVTPFREFELDSFLARVGRPRTTRRDFQMPSANAKDLAVAKDVGGRLFGALFPGQAMTACLVGSLAEARSHHKGLRIRLRVTADCSESPSTRGSSSTTAASNASSACRHGHRSSDTSSFPEQPTRCRWSHPCASSPWSLRPPTWIS